MRQYNFDEWLHQELVRYRREQMESFYARRYGQFPKARVEHMRPIRSHTESTSGFI